MKGQGQLLSRLYELAIYNRKRDLAAQLKIESIFKEPKPLLLEELELLRKKLLKYSKGKRAYFFALDFFIRSSVEPVQAILNELMNGAKAQVDKEEIPFLKIISWCQRQANNKKRAKLEREASALCKFLAPFSHSTWQATLRVVKEELHYQNYFSFLEDKRGEDLKRGYKLALNFLNDSSSLYFKNIKRWLSTIPEPIELEVSTRYDAIFLLGLRYLDKFLNNRFKKGQCLEKILKLFSILIPNENWLKIHFSKSGQDQAYCVPVKIPTDIHIIVCPINGFLDLEGLLHELGHALFFLNNPATLSLIDKDFYISFALCESYAFLFQLISMDYFFLTELLDLDDHLAQFLNNIHKMKLFTLARRYASKTIIEYENFKQNRFSKGQDLYAKKMKDYTGFYYGKETYLFDLMPDMYSLDYFEAFLASFSLKRILVDNFGNRWFLNNNALLFLKNIFQQGNKLQLRDLLKNIFGIELNYSDILNEDAIKNFNIKYVKKMAQKI